MQASVELSWRRRLGGCNPSCVSTADGRLEGSYRLLFVVSLGSRTKPKNRRTIGGRITPSNDTTSFG